jgi:hypothetical protein
MLWSEKINFVKTTIENKYFDTEYHGWCDIGYFRNRVYDTPISKLRRWGDVEPFYEKFKEKIVYGRVNYDKKFINNIYKITSNRLENGLTSTPIPEDACTLAGGFFILHKTKIHWWHETYYKKLQTYFDVKRVVKDDQIVLVDCIFENLTKFALFSEPTMNLDCWFMFQRILSPQFQA